MNSIQKTLGIGSLVLALASGCFKSLNSGKVVAKSYEPQREYVKKVFFNKKLTFPHNYASMIDDEDHIITFGRTEEGEFRTQTVYVTKSVYDSLKVGDTFNTSKITHETSDPDYRK